MISDYLTFDETVIQRDPQKYLKRYFKLGQISLLIGAGASMDLGFPNWTVLVDQMIEHSKSIKGYPTIKRGKKNNEEVTELIKSKLNNNRKSFYSLVGEALYKNINYDFNTVKKELLIAISSLVTSRSMGSVNEIYTYNFDDLLEWYFNLIGLETRVIFGDKSENYKNDISIFHLHGYLPINNKGNTTENNVIVLTDTDFKKKARKPNEYPSSKMYDLLKNHVFLSIGVSPYSIKTDVIEHIDILLEDYYKLNEHPIEKHRFKKVRDKPFGFCLFPYRWNLDKLSGAEKRRKIYKSHPQKISDSELKKHLRSKLIKSQVNDDFKKIMISKGLIPIDILIDEIPKYIFDMHL